MKVGFIVEGHGEVYAVPILARRLAERFGVVCEVHPPIRVRRPTIVREGELERHVDLLGDKVGPDGRILVLLDADDDLACQLGPALLARAQRARPDRTIGVALAVREYEAWFLAAAASLRGQRGLPDHLEPPQDPERVRDAKGWLSEQMPRTYNPTTDQPAFTSRFDLEVARTAPSFDKFVREFARLMDVPSVFPPGATEGF